MERLAEKGHDLGFGQRAVRGRATGLLSWLWRALHLAVWAVETVLDTVKRPVLSVLGWGRPRSVMPFEGGVSEAAADGGGRVMRFGCRVLATAGLGGNAGVEREGGPRSTDSWWRNLRATLRRWDTRELPDVLVTATGVGAEPGTGVELKRQTDREGYGWFDVPVEGAAEVPDAVMLRAERGGHAAEATASVFTAPPGCGLGIISDVDDTVLHTGITNLLTAAKLTFLRNARTRSVLAGAPALYAALVDEAGARRPIFYISSSAWNLHDLLTDFIALNELPPGPLLLRDLGVDRFKLLKSSGHDHKLRKAERVLADFPSMRFVLLGDSGQADPALYAELAASHPGRVAAIVIRDIDKGEVTERDAKARAHLEAAGVEGVPSFLVRDSVEAAVALARVGLLDAAALPAIEAATAADLGRPSPLAAAVRSAGARVPGLPKRVLDVAADVAERLES